VIGVRHTMRPFGITRFFWRAAAVLELPPGTLKSTSTAVGDVIEFSAISSSDRGPAIEM
jgi:uncharacterized membrane protein (UPF0127 family)